uniref:Uncharacterized protein n=1 Tax=Vespula pensylvanica TaxID=30213 RepID=A0A834KUS9_VESPE|nr:hypothetical protein H0235_013182 [Vespula pensylvanica]
MRHDDYYTVNERTAMGNHDADRSTNVQQPLTTGDRRVYRESLRDRTDLYVEKLVRRIRWMLVTSLRGNRWKIRSFENAMDAVGVSGSRANWLANRIDRPEIRINPSNDPCLLLEQAIDVRSTRESTKVRYSNRCVLRPIGVETREWMSFPVGAVALVAPVPWGFVVMATP